MTISSMTGFARSQGTLDGVSWDWEIRSLNGRRLDVRTRLGQGMEAVDALVRGAINDRLKRGTINVSFNVQCSEGAVEIRLNETVLAQTVKALNRVREVVDCAPVSAEGLLGIKGVLEWIEVDDARALISAGQTRMMETFHSALDELVADREREGRGLAAVLSRQLDEIERLVGVIEKSDARRPDVVRARLKEQVLQLCELTAGLDEGRLYQEAALLATRFDIEEELKRLEQHIGAARKLLETGGEAGRKLDFLAQEFNREANTLCSKSNDGDVSEAGLALKVVIDQMREQVQNIE